MTYEFNKRIKTVGELREYLGKPLFFCYPNEVKKDFAWIKVPTECPTRYADDYSIEGVGLKGFGTVQVYKKRVAFPNMVERTTPKFLYKVNDITHSNAQTYMRTLTKEEFKMYARLIKNERFYKTYEKTLYNTNSD